MGLLACRFDSNRNSCGDLADHYFVQGAGEPRVLRASSKLEVCFANAPCDAAVVKQHASRR